LNGPLVVELCVLILRLCYLGIVFLLFDLKILTSIVLSSILFVVILIVFAFVGFFFPSCGFLSCDGFEGEPTKRGGHV
jgi:hypothetical protein